MGVVTTNWLVSMCGYMYRQMCLLLKGKVGVANA